MEYGMSEKLGQVYLSRKSRPLFLDAGMPESREFSEATAEMIDREIKNIIDTEYRKALSIISEKKSVLIKGAKLLLEKEKIDEEDLKTLLAQEAANIA